VIELQPVAPVAGRDQVVQRQRRTFHRHPAALGRHGVRHVDEQRDRRLRTRLGLGHLDVADVDPQSVARVATLDDGALYGVGDRTRDVPGLRVAERPLAGGACLLTRRAGHAGVPRARTSRQLLRGVGQQGLAQLPHRGGGEAKRPVRRTAQQARRAQLALDLGQPSRRDGRLVAQLARESVHVDVLHVSAAVPLAQLLRERLQLGEILQHAGPVTQPETLVAAERLLAAPVLAGPKGLQVRVQLVELLHEVRRAECLRRSRP
jgi:hypothetical protein